MINADLPKVVILGGGTGLSVLLRGIKRYPLHITAIVTVADDGGSSGRIREDLRIPPPGDIRNVLAALSEVEPLIEEMFQHRFRTNGDLSGHSLGNLILAAMTNITGNFAHAVHELSRVLNVKGRVFPSANQLLVLHAEMEDGTIVEGESKIPTVGKKIKRVFITPENAEPLPEAVHAIRDADLIIIGPGSLYTSILPNLLVPKIGEEVLRAKGKKIYICNLMTQAGETKGFTASEHVKAIYQHLREPFLHTIIVNDGIIPENIQLRYKGESAEPVLFDQGALQSLGLEVLSDSIISTEDGTIRHDTKKVSEMIYRLIKR
ncbi:gluconeogenesis factor YvcK family protein [Fervidibacillus albus]|uniref:Gluconeogenesis factor n=1 Tax=Fervidibacillus albus TaxID=2980026 RepID=A0A9E8LVI8_9BACI|nr:YvcK family protein [Fervidibacillus albus]WAA09896.1 YvcK family protein [Fervidibacillus albus]